jgi:hypothetical protein
VSCEFFSDYMVIRDYPFCGGVVAKQKGLLRAAQIIESNPGGYPPTMRIADELVFLARRDEEKLRDFSLANAIPVKSRPDLIAMILETFSKPPPGFEEANNEKLRSFGVPDEEIRRIRRIYRIVNVFDYHTYFSLDPPHWDLDLYTFLDSVSSATFMPPFETIVFPRVSRFAMSVALKAYV